jgi:hypothetical protein
VLLTLLACLSASSAAAALPDGRGWELVSPIEKNGGSIAAAGQIAAGGDLQAAADGNSVTYGSAAAFGAEAQGAPAGSQYLATRGGGGWASANITVPIFSGSYGSAPEGVPYQLFSADLSRALLLSGRHCRSVGNDCPVANPPLAGSDAPAGYQNYYLRQGGGFEALLDSGDLASTAIAPADFNLTLAGASPDLQHVVLSSCAALAPDASEVVLGEGCDPAKANLYEWSSATGLSLVNSAPGAELAAQSGAISADGSRVYWSDLASGDLFLREGTQTKQIDTSVGGGGSFQTASPDGSVGFFTKEAHLYRYQATTDTTTDLTPAGGVVGVLGASTDATRLYYLGADGLYLWRAGGAPTKIAAAPSPGSEPPSVDPSSYPPATGAARVSSDGNHLLFVSQARLTGYDNTDQKTGLPDSEVFLYDAAAEQLRCVSCRPSGLRPIGPSTIPGAVANGEQTGATDSYKPRALSADGSRAFFDSRDAVFGPDTNNDGDVYQWEVRGPNCTKVAGCVNLISSGRSEGASTFVDASATGGDVFFTTDDSLVGTDPGSFDLYDARVGGGFPEPLVPIPCFGDSCQNLPGEPVDPALTTQTSGPGNPKVHYLKYTHHGEKHCKAKKCHKGKKHNTKKHKKKGRR